MKAKIIIEVEDRITNVKVITSKTTNASTTLKSAEYNYMKKYYHGRTLVSSFIKGFMIAICRKMQDMYECRKNTVSNEVGLMVIDKNKKVQQQYEDLDIKVKAIKNRDLKYEREAFLSGIEKGQNTSLIQGIEQCEKESTLMIG